MIDNKLTICYYFNKVIIEVNGGNHESTRNKRVVEC
jgi:very-short-patch-repair endonuclease